MPVNTAAAAKSSAAGMMIATNRRAIQKCCGTICTL